MADESSDVMMAKEPQAENEPFFRERRSDHLEYQPPWPIKDALPGPLEADIKRREIKLTGTAHDINRLATACSKALKQAEAEGDFDSVYSVYSKAPQDDEP